MIFQQPASLLYSFIIHHAGWWFALVVMVMHWSQSTKLHYAGSN